MRIALYIAHAGATRDASGWHLQPAVADRYRAAVAPHELELHCDVAGQGQGYPAYVRRAAELRAAGGGSLWRGIRGLLPAADLYLVGGFSAGGALVRELARGADPERDRELGGYVDLDGSYAKEPSPGEPAAADVAPLVEALERARAGGPVVVLGASEVDPVAYASTDEVLRALMRSAQLQRHQYTPHAPARPGVHELLSEAEGLGCLLRWYAGRDAAGHSAALVEWGPGLVAEAVRLASTRHAEPTDRPPPTSPGVWTVLAREGVRGPRAGHVQRIVGATVDRIWGPLTSRRLGLWQAAHGLPVEPVWTAYAQAVAEAEGAPPLPEEPRRRRCVDVSEAQGSVDWVAARADGVELAYARATYGTHVDRQFEANWAGMRAAGIERGAYGVILPEAPTLPVGAVSVEHQAHTLARCTGPLGEGDLRTAIDVEPPGPYARSTAAILQWHRDLTADQLVRFARVVHEVTGKPGRCYTSPGLWVWGSCLADIGCDLWVADARGSSLAADAPVSLPVGWDEWAIWQRGVAPLRGEPAPVDDDVAIG